jgi:peptidoglycan/xylan/chitin deacetylase (PgdA/CDA1 family)
MIERVGRRGYRLTLGSVYPLDAQIGWSAFSAWFITNVIQPGSIIVLHEGGARGERTIRTLRTILPELKRRGYTVVTVTELLGHAPQPEGGHALMPRRHVPHPDDHAGG